MSSSLAPAPASISRLVSRSEPHARRKGSLVLFRTGACQTRAYVRGLDGTKNAVPRSWRQGMYS